MNRKQRRATQTRGPIPGGPQRGAPADPAAQLYAEAAAFQQQNKLNDAVRSYKRLLLLKPDHAQASNNLGVVLLAQGKPGEASARFAHALTLMPQLLDQYAGVCETLVTVLPPLGEAMMRATRAWPAQLSAEQLLGVGGIAAIGGDPMLLCVLQAVPVRNLAFEHLLTSLRRALLDMALGGSAGAAELAFCCALAKQCFINEYVYAVTPDEEAQVDKLIATLGAALAAGKAIAPIWPAAIALYRPLNALPFAQGLLTQKFAAPVDAVLTQQLREPLEERELRNGIAQLTPVDDEVSRRVRQQYEENPYPRWVNVDGGITPVALDQHLRNKFPTVPFTPLGKTEDLEILVAGSGTGSHPIEMAQGYQGARVLAVDLSLASLAYGKRKTPARLAGRIEFAQADILKLGSLGRSFDLIDASGVLHHLADPAEGWRILLKLLRPGGIMHLGFYSEVGRRDVVAARQFIAEHGYGSTPEEIRRCRQDLLKTPTASVARFTDFFSTSECRDLLFHVQESRMTLPAIKAFIDAERLKFIGFDLGDAAAQNFRQLFAANGWSMTDLARWDAVEREYPNTFSTMYNFWLQKD